ncbi:MAG: hypothetical protein H6825_14480 [Planctomycetes bacterium]|nr:hypothetical protein [Planctomycetota bacterium]
MGGCFGLSERDQAQLSLHVENSLDYHKRGSYTQALQQARFALRLEDDNITMRIVEGDCLVKLGAARGDSSLIEEGMQILESLAHGDGSDYYGSWLALARADIARAIAHQDESAKIERRLRSDYLGAADRKKEEGWYEVELASAKERFEKAESALRRVLEFDNQADNIEATVELVIVLNSLGGRDDEAVTLAGRAITLLQEATQLARRLLQKDLSLDPEKKLELQRRIDSHLAKEAQLRDIQLTIHYRQQDLQACLADLGGLELRQLMRADHYRTRAEILEALGRYDEAATDLGEFLRLRSRTSDYDDVAAAAYDDIERLKALSASATP